ncbi:MAG: hypothetical protein JXA10_12180 [Anaerolineae bacterium]|nr:hypothetical protein [Anaerolineae bacterium]
MTTLIVVLSNGSTAIIATALLMLVLWQAPGRRMNQLFALVMAMLASYTVANAFGRFIGDMGWNPSHASYIAITLYGMFSILIYWFAAEFAQEYTPASRWMRFIGILMIIIVTIALWSNLLLKDIKPTERHDGSYAGTWTPLGLTVVGTQLIYLTLTTILIYRMEDERGRALWKAPLWFIGGMIYSAVIWPVVQIPVQAVFLAIGALSMGLPVLRYELFNPQAQLNEELAKTNQDLREMSRLKTQFLRNMSHELRTPLNSIIGYTQMIMGGIYGPLTETQEDRLEKVIRNGNNLLNLINDVLDLNRMETGMVQLECDTVETGTLLDHVLSSIEVQATQKGLTLTRAFDGVPAIYADENRLNQIITNIVANAVKFTDTGGVTVRAQAVGDQTAGEPPPAKQFVQIEIEDTGIGIPRAQWNTVFEEFRQVDESSTKRHEGTGLGLAISKRLVELHGGQIWLNSTQGKGTTFYVKLPVHPLRNR